MAFSSSAKLIVDSGDSREELEDALGH